MLWLFCLCHTSWFFYSRCLNRTLFSWCSCLRFRLCCWFGCRLWRSCLRSYNCLRCRRFWSRSLFWCCHWLWSWLYFLLNNFRSLCQRSFSRLRWYRSCCFLRFYAVRSSNALKALCQSRIYTVQFFQALCCIDQDHIHTRLIPCHQLVQFLKDAFIHITGLLNDQVFSCQLICQRKYTSAV